jgi:beta-lactamase class A
MARGEWGGLRFWNISSYEKDLNKVIEEIRDMPGEKSLAIIKNGKLVASINENVPLAVASGFKVAVILALEQAVRSRKLSWSDVVVLSDEQRSLPTGISQDWPAGLHVTLETAAVLAVSLSDNTMSDVLVSAVGRERVELLAPNSRPFLTTREAFVLKNPRNAELADRFVRSSVVDRRKLLAALQDEKLPPPSILGRGPANLDVEWFFTAAEMAGMMMQLSRKDFFSISSPPFDSSLWKSFAYKGGWEPGVFSTSAWLRSKSGAEFAFSLISNSESPGIAVDKLSEITARLAYALAHAG